MTPLFTATETFGPSHAAWAGYVAWSGLSQLTELISLDGLLCGSVLALQEDDRPFLAEDGRHLLLFNSLPHLLGRLGHRADRNLLCLYRNPLVRPDPPPHAPPFELVGYDLIEREGNVSALSNCGGFPAAFVNAELTGQGLLPDLARARQVQAALRRLHPLEAHADCDVWAVFISR